MWKAYKKFIKFVLAYKGKFVVFFLLVSVLGVINAIHPYFYKFFIEKLPERNSKTLYLLLLGYVGLRFLEVIFDVLTYWVGDSVLLPAARDAREAVFKKIQELDFAYHLSKSTGSLISVFKRGDLAFFNLFHNFNAIYRILIHLVVMLVVFSSINSQIFYLMIISFLISSVATRYLLENNIKKRKEFNKEEDEISTVIVDNLMNYETVKYFGKEREEQKRLSETFVKWITTLWGYANSFRMIDFVIGFLSVSGLFLLLAVSLRQYMEGELRLSNFILILGFVSSFYYRFFDMVYRLRDVAKNYSDVSDYFKILDVSVEVEDPEDPVELKLIKGEVEFDKVSFSYKDNDKDALSDFSLRIRQGQSVALVGESGVGKTTVVKLLLRFFDVDNGEISIDGVSVAEMKKSYLREIVGVVPQEPIMFNNTIKYNIAYGREEVSDKEIEGVAKMANLDDFINGLPKGYETDVGERGVKLSGGQKQRLAIARMFISNPEIIVFDEATSQLDSESEKLIQDAFWKVSKNKTTIIIAHRLSTVVRADKIVVMENGKIAESGSHRELVAKDKGIYKKYWDLQVEEI